MIDAKALASALNEVGPDSWTAADIADYSEAASDLPSEPDAEDIAHALWTMGAVDPSDHECIYADGDRDADYENDCERCEELLMHVAREVLRIGL